MYSNWFKREEFACKCGCGFDTVDAELLEVLEDVRMHFGKAVTVTSGCRCEEHNTAVGGMVNSYHKKGRAADIKVAGTRPSDVQSYLRLTYPDSLGIGSYNSFTHIDSRSGKARF